MLINPKNIKLKQFQIMQFIIENWNLPSIWLLLSSIMKRYSEEKKYLKTKQFEHY